MPLGAAKLKLKILTKRKFNDYEKRTWRILCKAINILMRYRSCYIYYMYYTYVLYIHISVYRHIYITHKNNLTLHAPTTSNIFT